MFDVCADSYVLQLECRVSAVACVVCTAVVCWFGYSVIATVISPRGTYSKFVEVV